MIVGFNKNHNLQSVILENLLLKLNAIFGIMLPWVLQKNPFKRFIEYQDVQFLGDFLNGSRYENFINDDVAHHRFYIGNHPVGFQQ